MAKELENRSKRLITRFNTEEYGGILKRFSKTNFRKLSQYTRSLLLEKPVTVFYRNRSMDEVLEELVLLRRELNAVGNNLNQSVKNINSLHGLPDTRLWMDLLAIIKTEITPKVGEINQKMNEYSDVWSQLLKAGQA